ncbi:MAG: division/cell wall cluster transcriptional repressor MraZ [Acidobacteria bacterium]|nr:MAG: division/cell wall cluster transcriptional repressor MraZ [Acidobacteriota bacterium]
MLRGNSPARIDEKGRLKIPTTFRNYIEQQYGSDVFITSISGEFVRIYPMAVWLEIEKKVAAVSSMNPTIMRFLNRVNYYGSVGSLDAQGRVVIQPLLRKAAEVTGEVAVLGNQRYLDVWNREKFEAKMGAEPVTEEDQRVLAGLGI